MKYLKLFEAFVSDVKFYRFSKEDFLDGQDESTYQPKSRQTWGYPQFNEYLVNLGFPDRTKCIHFMDTMAFNSGELDNYKNLYGHWVYEIEVDENSNLGWSFCLVVNDWYFHYYLHKLDGNPVVEDVRNYVSSLETQDEQEITNLRIDYVIERGIIGTGTLQDLKNSPFYGKQPVFVWTTDDVKMKVIDSPKKISKDPKSYKNEPVINSEDFLSRGIQSKEIGQFYQSEFGKTLKREQLGREEALRLLDEWVKTR